MEDKKIWIYVGKGAFLDGVPARDLTETDFARLDGFQQAAVESSALYRRAPKPKVAEPNPESARPPAAPEKDDEKGAKARPAAQPESNGSKGTAAKAAPARDKE